MLQTSTDSPPAALPLGGPPSAEPSRLAIDGHFLLLLGCFVLSGMAGLIYETAWTQEFGLIFGASETAVAAVLSAYMGGLMLGAAFGGWLLRRVRRTLWLYAVFELAIALFALAVPTAIRLAGDLQVHLFGGREMTTGSGSVWLVLYDLLSAFLILLPATAMMGATLPLLARHAVRHESEIGTRIGLLYTANTLGAASGTLLAAFVLLPSFGLGQTVWIAVALNALVFVLAWLLSRASTPDEAPSETESAKGSSSSGRGWILPLILVSGFVSLGYEVLWSRVLSHLLGGSIYAFATMLAAFLLGIAFGSAVASRVAHRVETARKAFILVQIGAAVAFYAAFSAVDTFASLLGRSALQDAGFLASGVGLSALTLLPGALFLGASFPLAVRLLAGDAADAGIASARVFSWNTLGAIGGAVITGFFVLPVLRFGGTVQAAVATSLLVALCAAALPRPRYRALTAAAALGLVLLVLLPPRTPWKVLRTSPFSGRAAAGETAYYGVGQSATVLLLQTMGEWRLTTNGLPESAIQPPGSREGRFGIAHWLGLLPHLAKPDVRSTLVVGMGAGITLSAVPQSVEDVHLVELEPEVLAANRAVAEIRAIDPLADPRLTVHVDDARSTLRLSTQRFDAIVSQPSHPWTAGASHLFTREFFTLVRDRLSDDGVFVQWIGLRFVDADLMRTLLATLDDVFTQVEVFAPSPGGAALFLASKKPFDIASNAPLAFELAADQWRLLGMHSPVDLQIQQVLDHAGSRTLASGAEVSTDHRNRLQIRAPKILHRSLGSEGAAQLWGEMDPLRRVPAPDRLYAVRQLILQKAIPRARALLSTFQEPAHREIGLALIDLAEGRGPKGERALQRLMLLENDSTEALGALVKRRHGALSRGIASADLTVRVNNDPVASLIVEGWRLGQLLNSQALEEYDSRLAAIDPQHPLYVPSVRLRIGWRQASGDPQHAVEALPLFDGLIASGRVTDRELLQRAILASKAGDIHTALASAYELAALVLRMSTLEDSRPKMLNILRTVPGFEPTDPRFVRVQRILQSPRSGRRASTAIRSIQPG